MMIIMVTSLVRIIPLSYYLQRLMAFVYKIYRTTTGFFIGEVGCLRDDMIETLWTIEKANLSAICGMGLIDRKNLGI